MKQRALYAIGAVFAVACVMATLTVLNYNPVLNKILSRVESIHRTTHGEDVHLSLSETSSVARSSADKSWRRTNLLVTEYRSRIGARLSALASRQAAADDPEVIQLARDVIDPVPPTAETVGIKRSREFVKTPQAAVVEKLTKQKVTKLLCNLLSAR